MSWVLFMTVTKVAVLTEENVDEGIIKEADWGEMPCRKNLPKKYTEQRGGLPIIP